MLEIKNFSKSQVYQFDFMKSKYLINNKETLYPSKELITKFLFY